MHDTNRFRGDHYCPECGNNLGIEVKQPPPQCVCSCCAAIAWYDSARAVYRMPRTAEWMAIINLPYYLDLCELYHATLEELTAPKASQAAKEPAGRRKVAR